jgi:hypothetical protein
MQLEPAGTANQLRIYWPSVNGALAYDVIRANLSALRVEGSTLSLGTVKVIGRGTTGTMLTEPTDTEKPPVGQAFIYMIQHRTAERASGYGTESAPWPAVPTSCDGGCPPDEDVAGAGGSASGHAPRR